MTLFLGLDVGTSGVKAILVDGRGNVTATATVSHPLATPQPGWAEQNPSDWWRAATAAIRRVLDEAHASGQRVSAVGLSGQMHSSVFLDRANQVIRPAILWCDGRTTEQCRALTEKIGETRLRELACNPALEGFTLPKVLWLRDREPKAFERVAKVVQPKDYIRFCLTDTLATDPSDASATLMYETARWRWCDEILRELKLPASIVADVGGSTEVLGSVSPAAATTTGLVAGTPVAGGGADNACGAVGVGAVGAGEVVASWGTSGTVLAATSAPMVDPSLRAHTFCHVLSDAWYVMGVMLTAGGAFAWHRSVAAAELAEKAEANLLLNAEAAKVPIGCAGLTFLPYLQGERTPHRDPAARGAYVGLSLAHARAHMTRAVLEGIAFGMRDSVAVLRDLGVPLEGVLLTGGGAASPLLRQLQADVYGLPVVTVNREEGPAYGAALLGAVAVGAFSSVQQACSETLVRGKQIAPDAGAHAAFAEPYERFRSLYTALKGHF